MEEYNRHRPALASIRERYLLTGPGSTKETYHISLNINGLGIRFEAGDAIGVLARNDPIWVEQMLEALGASGEEGIVHPRSALPFKVGEFLSTQVNLERLTFSLFQLTARNHPQFAPLLHPDNKPQLVEYLKTHDPLTLLQTYQGPPLPLQEVCAQLSPLLPRFYSAASSPKYSPETLDLTIALLSYSHAGKKRFGVASHFLCRQAKTDVTPIPLYVQPAHHFRLPADTSAPLLMIGPGTGIAPFRAFLQERIAQGASGKHWLFFGERHRNSDFFYEKFWHELTASGILQLDTAFSRDQSEKLYVQHRMYERKKELWRWLQEGAYLYVCGDAERMAKAVENTLYQIAQDEGLLSLDAAKAYFKKLRSEKRYLLDIY